MSDKAIKIIGWVGVVFIVGAYMLLSFNAITSHNILYQLLNLFGAVGIIIEAGSKKDLQPVVINIIWVIVAAFAIANLLFR